jgi:Penicillinase repressor
VEHGPVIHSRTARSVSRRRKIGVHDGADRCLSSRRKKAVRRTGKTNNAHVFEAVVSRSSAQHRMIDDLVALFGGKRLPLMTRLIESGKLTPEEIREARKALRDIEKKGKSS